MVQPFPTMQGMPRDVQAGVEGEDAEMVDEPIALGDCGVVTEVIGECRVADVMRDGDDVGGRMAVMVDEMQTAASEDGEISGLGGAVRGGSGADVGQSPAGVGDDGAGDVDAENMYGDLIIDIP